MEVKFDLSKFESKLDDMMKTVEEVEKKAIKIGVLTDDSELQMIANVHEYGATISVTPKMRAWFAYSGYPLKSSTTNIVIPERSYLRTGIAKNKKAIASKTKKQLANVVTSNANVNVFMQSIGDEFAGLIQKNLRDIKTPANSGMTIAKKGSSNPLVDTGRLMGSIEAKVVAK